MLPLDGYRNPVWDLYDLIYEQSIKQFLADHTPQYDVVIAADIIEHFAEAHGQEILARLKQRVSSRGQLIVVTPAVFFEQPAVYGNPFEVHRSYWPAKAFRRLGFEVTFSGHNSRQGDAGIKTEEQERDLNSCE